MTSGGIRGVLSRFSEAQTIRYACVGGSMVLLYASLLWLIVHLTGLPGGVSSLLTVVVLIPTTFFLQRRLTFRSHGPVLAEFTNFLAVVVLAIPLGTFIIFVLVDLLHLNPFIGGLVASGSQPLFTYILQARLVFRRNGARP